MALARDIVGLVFRIDADTKAARAELNQFKGFVNNQARALNQLFAGQLTPALSSGLQGFNQISTSALAAVGPVGLVAGAVGLVATAVAGLTAALFGLTKASAETGARLFDLSDKTGISIRNLDLFRRAALEAGKGLDVVERSFDQFTTRLETASSQKTTTELNRVFRSLGIDAKTALQDVDKTLDTAIRNLNNLENSALRGARAQEIFGLRNEAIIPILTRIGESLDAYERRIGNVGRITEAQARAAKSFDVSLNILNATIKGVSNSIGAELLPLFQALVDFIQTQVLIVGRGLLNLLGQGKDGIKGLADAIDLLNAAFRSLPSFVNVARVAFSELRAIISSFHRAIVDAAVTAAQFFAGDFAGAVASGAGGIASATVAGLTLGDRTKAALAGAITETNRQFRQLQADRRRLSLTGRTGLDEKEREGEGEKKKKGIEEFDLAKRDFQLLEKLAKEELDRAIALNKLREDAEREHRQALEQINREFDDRTIALIERDAEQRAISEQQAAEQIGAIRIAAFKQREDQLQEEIDSVRNRLRANAEEGESEAGKAIRAELLAEEQAFIDELELLQARRARTEEEAVNKVIDARRRDIDNLIETQRRRRDARANELQDQGFNPAVAEALAAMEILLGRNLTLWEQNRIAAQAYADALEEQVANALARVTDITGLFADALGAGIDAFIDSAGSLKSAGEAVKKALISPFIELARFYAKYYAAMAIASLAAFDIRGAILYGLAAAGFAALGALGTALVGGGSGGGTTAPSSSFGGRSSQQQGTRIIEQGDRRRSEPQVIIIRAETEEGVIVRRVMQDYRANGGTRQLVRGDILGEQPG